MATPYRKSFYRELKTTATAAANQVLPFIVEHIQPKSVIDVGCAAGDWLSVCDDLGISDVHGVDIYDGAVLSIPRERYDVWDLTKPYRLSRTFDFAMSLEVAENVPADHAQTLVESITRLAPVVLFSSAIPGQGGTYHVNEQWPAYWAAHFRKFGYEPIDCMRPVFWSNPRVASYYAQNMILYVADRSRFASLTAMPSFSILPLVHPGLYDGASEELRRLRPLRTAAGLIRRLPGALWNSMADRVRKAVDR